MLSIDREICLSEDLVEMNENGFCHHCKQLRTTYIMAKCNYNTLSQPNMMPNLVTVNGF